MHRSNYLWGHENPWQLAGPPAWWLDLLYAADPDLVLFPSKTTGVYRVARRCPQNIQPLMTALRSVPDTSTYVNHRLMPITSLLPFTNWSPLVISDLMAMNIERFGGWQKAARALDDFDERQERALDREIENKAHALAHDTWWSKQFQTGSAVSMAHRKRDGARTTTGRRRAPAYRPLNFSGGSAVFVGDKPARTTGMKIKPYVAPDSFVGAGNARSVIITP
jgi:hypothetical protein